jgi:hypothetical protein
MGDETSYMSGHSLAFNESFHGGGSEPYMELFVHQAKRNTIVVMLHLDVVVDVDRGHPPLGILIRSFGKRRCVRAIEQLKELAAGLLYLA